MRGKWLLAGGAVVLLAIAAGALSVWWRERAPRPATVASADAPAPGPEVTLPGKVRAQHVVPVGVGADGVIDEFYVEVGEEVYEGQLLARVKNAMLESVREQAQVDMDRARNRVANLDGQVIAARLEASRASAESSRARSDYERANKVFERQRLLYREGAAPRLAFEKSEKEHHSAAAEHQHLSEAARVADDNVTRLTQELERARKGLAAFEEDLEAAKEALLAAEVHAPVDGIVVARRGEPGGEVNPTLTDLFQIAVDLSLLEVAVEPAPPVLARLKAGQQAMVYLAELANEGISGSVKAVKENEAVVEFTSPLPAIKPGLTAQVRIRIG